MPSLKGLNRPALMAFLGDDFNSVLTRDEAPIEGVDVPRACDILPAIEGSAGESSVDYIISVQCRELSTRLWVKSVMGL